MQFSRCPARRSFERLWRLFRPWLKRSVLAERLDSTTLSRSLAELAKRKFTTLEAALSTPSSKLFSMALSLPLLSAVTKRKWLASGCNFLQSFVQGARPHLGQREIIRVFRRRSTPNPINFAVIFCFSTQATPTVKAQGREKMKAPNPIRSSSHGNPSLSDDFRCLPFFVRS